MANPTAFLSHLDDMADPTDEIDQMIRHLTGQTLQRSSAIGTLPQDREDSLLGELAGAPLTALQWVGETLDKPGAAVRGLLAGKPEDLLNLVPFSDTFGITDPKQRTSGRDLLEKAGLLDANTPGLDWGDVAGFGADVLTDPLTYMTFGGSAAGKAGQVAKAIGVLPKAELGAVATEGLSKGIPILKRGVREAGMQSTLKDVLTTPELVDAATKAAKGLGEELPNLMDDPLRKLIGIGLPFSEPAIAFGSGPLSQKVARGLDVLGHGIRYSAPGRALATKFSPAVQEAKSAAGQVDMAEAFARRTAGESEALTSGARDYLMLDRHGLTDQDANQILRQMAERTHVGAAPEVAARNLDDVLNYHFANNPKLRNLAPEAQGEIAGMLKRRWNEGDSMLKEAIDAGIDIEDLAKRDPTVAWWHRQRTNPAIVDRAGGRVRSLSPDAAKARAEELINIPPTDMYPGGTGTLEAIAQDPVLSGPHRNTLGLTPEQLTKVTDEQVVDRSLKQAAAFGGGKTAYTVPATFKETTTLDDAGRKIFEEYLGQGQHGVQDFRDLAALEEAAAAGGPALSDADSLALEAYKAKAKQARALADWAANLDPRHAAEKFPVFGNSIIEDATVAKLQHAQVISNAKATTDMLARSAMPGDGTAVRDAMARVGLRTEQADQNLAKRMLEVGNNAVDPTTLKTIAAGYDTTLTGKALADAKQAWTEARSALRNVGVSDAVLADAMRARNLLSNPKEQTWLGKVFDSYTNLTKAWLTSAWPGFHARNDFNGFWQQLMTGSHDPRYGKLNPLAWIKPQQEALTILSGKTLKGASEIPGLTHLTDEQATEALRSIAYGQHTGTHFTQTGEIVGRAGKLPGVDETMQQIPGIIPIKYGDAAKALIPDQMSDLLKVGGVRGQTMTPAGKLATETGRDVNPIIRAGRVVGDITERKHQLATLISQLRQGKTPDVAGAIARAAHVDYRLSTQFEKDVMKRLFPFYTYTRNMIPWQVQRLIEKPGGLSGQAIRAVNATRDDQGFLPPQIAHGLAIPVGEKVPGQMTYLSGFDLPHELLNDVIRPGHTLTGALANTGLGIVSQMNPLVRGPLEMAFQKQAFSGRDLPDLDSRIGRLIQAASGAEQPPGVPNILDEVLMNSPASRVASTIGQLIDPRKEAYQKAVNLATGARFSTVDVDKSKQRAAMDAVNELLRDTNGVRFFENMSVSPEAVATLTPQELELVQLNKTIESRRRKKAKGAK